MRISITTFLILLVGGSAAGKFLCGSSVPWSWTCTNISCSFCYTGINLETTAAAGLIVSDGTTAAAAAAAAGIFSDETYDPYLNTKLIHDPDIYVDWKKVNKVLGSVLKERERLAAIIEGGGSKTMMKNRKMSRVGYAPTKDDVHSDTDDEGDDTPTESDDEMMVGSSGTAGGGGKRKKTARKMMSVQSTAPTPVVTTSDSPMSDSPTSDSPTLSPEPTKASKKPVVTKKPACKGDGSSGCTKKPVMAPPKKKPSKAPSKKPATKKPACKGDGSSGCTKKPDGSTQEEAYEGTQEEAYEGSIVVANPSPSSIVEEVESRLRPTPLLIDPFFISVINVTSFICINEILYN